ncbi:MAG: lamin tail domain-containing protein [Saprospiraceae bacterium]
MKLHRFLVFSLLFSCSNFLSAQIFDDFSDGNFDQNPAWQGDVANFMVNASNELQLNATVAGTSSLAVQGSIPASVNWKFKFRLDFSPSANNMLRIYLQSDQVNFASAKGYYLEIGENGSNDAIKLYRQDGGSSTLLGTGVLGLVAVSPDIQLDITRTGSGQWTVDAAFGGGAFIPQFNATDATYTGGANSFFGVQCLYTVSNIAKFYFDDLDITLGPADTDPPVLVSAIADNELQVSAVFNEALGPVNPSNFTINNGIGQPLTADIQPDGKTVVLGLASALPNGNYTLESTGAQDTAGNVSAVQTADFQFFKTDVAEEFDILINEIMADPAPSVGLPEVEWLELYNRSTKTLDLGELRVQDATGSPVTFPSYILDPGSYVAITALANVTSLEAATIGPVLGVGIGTTTLNNDGDVITISTAGGTVIDRVAYDVDWHTNSMKKDGGWSLERSNPGLPCLGSTNWVSCPVSPGGTPGLANASLDTSPDVTGPKPVQVIIGNPTSLTIIFSEGLDKSSAENPAAYQITPAVGIASATQSATDRAQVQLSLSASLELSKVYAITVNTSITDCSGNGASTTDTLYFGIPEAAAPLEVVINEIMAKPSPMVGLPVAEWIELYNRTDKIVDLASLRVQDLSGSPIALPSYLLLPKSYIAITASSNQALLQASSQGPVLGVGVSTSLLNDDGDVITLSDANGQVIDRVAYDKRWHTEDGKDDGGWSLERINYDLPCLGSENWQSCPVLPGGTPGIQNAAYRNTSDEAVPHLYWAYPESDNSVLLTFSEGLDKSAMENISSYQITPNLGIAAAIQQSNIAQVKLIFTDLMEDGILYHLQATQTLTDCSGNIAETSDTATFGIPLKPEPNDILINEVMFNPASGEPRYIELYNQSGKIFDWGKFYIANVLDGFFTNQIIQKRLSIPGQYHVFTSDAPNVRSNFQNIYQLHVMENSLPTLNDKEGSIIVYWVDNGDTVLLDALHYYDSWHNSLYSVGDRDGVALERIRLDGDTNDPSNWTSASSTITGKPGTPTLPNSQRLSNSNPAEDLISLNPARLSPDDDGYEDFLDIRYQLPKAGYAASMSIFDSDGNRLKQIAKQELLGTEGYLRWDGDTENGSKARPGIHILYMEIFGPDGDVMRIKKVFVVVQ